jgi:dipeptidyl aminopeptidase/acylaminoacyl peptidase
MRKLALLALLSATAGLSLGGPRPKTTLLFTVKDHIVRDPAVSSDGRRIYYAQDTSQLYMFDRATRKSTQLLGTMMGVGASIGVSKAGDRLAFTRNSEEGGKPQLWTVSLDPKTGLANGTPKRVSLIAAETPAFSPDGKSIAFATPTSRSAKNLIVIPVNGGPERVVAETQGDIWPIVWQKADTITFGGSFDSKEQQSKNGIYRVNASGGTPEAILRTADWGGYPGLSPDGRYLLAWEPTWDSVIVTTAAGKRVSVYKAVPGEVTPDVWATSVKAVGWRNKPVRAMHVVDLAGEQDRIIGDSAEIFTPTWSPDGRRVAVFRMSPSAFVISDVAAGTRRTIPVERAARQIYAVQWSPDGRFLAYHDREGGITLLDPSTSKARMLATKGTTFPIARWRSDSRALLYAQVDPPGNANAIKKIEIHEVTLDGQDRTLHAIEMQCGNSGACGKIVDDSLIMTWINGDYRIHNFRTRSAPRTVFTRDGTPQQPVATFSANGRWMAVRRQSATDQRWSIEVMHPDGSAHRSVPVSFPVVRGGRNPWISDDGSQLIVASADCAENQGHLCPGAVTTVYRVDVATGKAIMVASLTNATGQLEDAMISNDGRSLVYLRDIEKRVEFYELDFSDLLKGG